MLNEVIHSMKNLNMDGIILKIDFSKAYDSVDWSCVFHVLDCLKIGSRFIDWIKPVFFSTRMLILVNGSPSKEFSPAKDLRQGDPLAPYLFLLIGEILSKLLTRAHERGLAKGISFPYFDSQITHFQYADDTILFCKK